MIDAAHMIASSTGGIESVIKLKERLTRIRRDYQRSICEQRGLFGAPVVTATQAAVATKDNFIYSPFVSLFTKSDMTNLINRLNTLSGENLNALLEECDLFFVGNTTYQTAVQDELNKAIKEHLESAEEHKEIRTVVKALRICEELNEQKVESGIAQQSNSGSNSVVASSSTPTIRRT